MNTISVVLPAKDEAENIGVLVNEIAAALAGQRYDIVLVDDGSSDATADVALQTAKAAGAKLTVIRHAQSTGQSTALMTAVRHATGDYIATLDADGQNDPADIPKLLNAAPGGADEHWIVMGHRQKRQDTPWKRFQSRFANRFRQALLNDDCNDSGCGLKVLPRRTFLQLPYFNHMHRFMPAIVKRTGGRVVNVPVNHRARMQGVSKYTAWNRAWAGLLDVFGVMWLAYRSKPVSIAWQKVSDNQPGGNP